jgi:hypothetical protein
MVAAALAANVHGAAIEARQRPRTTTRGIGGGDPGITAPVQARNPQFSIGRPTASVTFFPNDPVDDRGERRTPGGIGC